ncbi:polysaccharide deacetylase family protein [Aneurinibacillus sp. Ricciae_BoGa-3]|uniref:polysaccharide deacetylase family protein n=1 Tax=Aneurinibacillus sp. Ricciae_BoGa-3 TaxID=3022697 RepID=UPI00233FDC29|nr:polysaccharide deacetylase family protein [Aneurinibacillus sp. Ricciae_BoGa-3]WCK56706.1 polysaccharide deacetylase family protein [Aneurinibacillus sp. Ricciae_BoGa-3]
MLLATALLFSQPLINEEVTQSHPNTRAYWESTGGVVWEAKTKEKLIALTFDDGPHPVYTPQISQLLEKYKARATFFVIGQRAESYKTLIQDLSKKGNEIANHTFSHPRLGRISKDKLLDEIKRTDDTIYSLTHKHTHLFRPPGGVYNEKIITTARTTSHLVVMWSWTQDTKDWSNPGAAKIANKVISHAKPGNIVLFHDSGGNRLQTVKAVEQILHDLTEQGYKFVTVSELLHKTGKNVPAHR